MNLNYKAPPTVAQFIKGREFFKILMGPIGAGKTVGCVFDLFLRAMGQNPDSNDERRTRMLVVRNTGDQLKQTTAKSINEWLRPGELCSWRASDRSYLFDLPLPDGTRMLSEWILQPLDEESSVRRLLSIEASGAWFSEIREASPVILEALPSRVRRYPARKDGGPTYPGVIGETNSPVLDSWLHKNMVDPPGTWGVYTQPPAVLRDPVTGVWVPNPEAENLDNLDPLYYPDLLVTNARNDEWLRTYLGNEFAYGLSGQPVFSGVFSMSAHLAPEMLYPEVSRQPILVGFDFGLWPAAVFGQLGKDGVLNVIAEEVGTEVMMETFLREQVLPRVQNEFAGHPVILVGDPTGAMRHHLAGGRTAFDLLRKSNIQALPAPTNRIEPRLQSVERRLTLPVSGRSAIQIDARCKELVKALAFGYRYKRKKGGDADEAIDKTHPASDVCDALQYLCLAVDTPGYAERAVVLSRPRPALRKGTALDLTGFV